MHCIPPPASCGGSAPSRPRRPRGPFAAALTLLLFSAAHCARPAGAAAATPRVHAIVGARIVTRPGQVIERGTIVLRDGVIEAVGAKVQVPADARVWEGTGLTVWPGMIDPFVSPPAPERSRARGAARSTARVEASEGAGHALATVTPERRMVAEDALDAKRIEALREAGFTAANVVPETGILRGQSAVFGLGDGASNRRLLKSDAAAIMSIETAPVGYPGSRMGAIAVMRQAFLDAAWYRDVRNAYARSPVGVERPEYNTAWDALQPLLQGAQPAFVRVDDMLGVLEAAHIGREAGFTPVVVGAGDSYKRVEEIAATGVSLIVPVRYPEVPDVSDPDDAVEVATEALRYWQDAPGNASVLAKRGIRFALTARMLEKPKAFRGAVTEAIARGLTPDQALAAVTTVPAAMLGLSNRIGTLAPGKVANLTVTTGDLFARGSDVREVWVDGNRYEVQPPAESFAGRWKIQWGMDAGTLVVEAGRDTTVKVIAGADTLEAKRVALSDRRLRFETGAGESAASFDITREHAGLTGFREAGAGETRARQELTGIQLPKSPDREEPEPKLVQAPVVMGQSEPWRMPRPEQPAAVLVRHATIWTAGPQGTVEAADLLVRNGKIAAVGRHLDAPHGAVVIDGTGRQVTPGIIDEHSHAAILGGVNECTNSNTAEVRIQDVINSESINIYRHLAGGTTIMHLLHGSCNAIGGQCAAIKCRWGEAPAGLWISDMPPTIKFALGENPKRSNFEIPGIPNRYPTSRGGVEQVYRDAFTHALDYRARVERVPRRQAQAAAPARSQHGGAAGDPRRQATRPLPQLPAGRDPDADARGRGLRLPHQHVHAHPRGLQGRGRDGRARRRRLRFHRLVGVQVRGHRRHSVQRLPDVGPRRARRVQFGRRRTRQAPEPGGREGGQVRGRAPRGGDQVRDDQSGEDAEDRRPGRLARTGQGRRFRDLVGESAVAGVARRADLDRGPQVLRSRGRPRRAAGARGGARGADRTREEDEEGRRPRRRRTGRSGVHLPRRPRGHRR